TGFALVDGGAYVGHGSELLLLKDTDDDGRADSREVIFTGFGTGDTHQNINSLTWSPGGELLFCQGLHTFSRVETPWGIERLEEHGVWRLRPQRRQLHAFYGGCGANPWGIAFGNWGQPFIKGNGPAVAEALAGMVHTGRWQKAMTIGHTQVRGMMIAFADSPHLPEDIREDLVIAGYYGRLVHRMGVVPDGSGHRGITKPPLLTSSHNGFRPVDICLGPDGAIYVADWYNPIIGHYQASLRHPNRDKTHGRIWRITAKDRPLDTPPALAEMDAAQLCKQLQSKVLWVRQQAKWRLMQLPADEVIKALNTWLAGLDTSNPDYEHYLYEAIGLFEAHEIVNQPLLERLLKSKDHRARAYAMRVAGRWHDRLESPLEYLKRGVEDKHPRVQLEAIVACSEV
ncbi:MAG: hypothetical protein N2C12_10700, partial [Planctomycetales bacterium]